MPDQTRPPAVFTFATAQEIRFGRGAAAQAAAGIGEPGTKVFLVHGATPGRADWLVRSLTGGGRRVALFACTREPDISTIEHGVAAARAFGAGVIVSCGGGAAIDTGKAIAALVPSERTAMDHLEVIGKGLPLDHHPLPFTAIPTTAGTGAEVTNNAVITLPGHKRKVSLRDARMLANLAIVDPALTDNTPRAVTLACGLDALTQVIEPYLSCKATRISDALCRDAIPQGLRALVRLMQGEDAGARDDLAWVSLCGGLALANSGLGAVHGLAGVIGGMTPAPHGGICGALLAHVLCANAAETDLPERAGTRLAEVAGWIAAELKDDRQNRFVALADWAHGCGLPGLGKLGVTADDLAEIAAASLSSSSMKGNPVVLSSGKLAAILGAALDAG